MKVTTEEITQEDILTEVIEGLNKVPKTTAEQTYFMTKKVQSYLMKFVNWMSIILPGPK